MNPRQVLQELRRRAATRLLPVLKLALELTDRLVDTVEAHASPDTAPVDCITHSGDLAWERLLHRPHLSSHEARKLVCEDELATARVCHVATMKPKQQREVNLVDYSRFRAELLHLGEWSVPERDPGPVIPEHLVDCHFDFEMPDEFAKNPAGDIDRTAFHVELDS